MKAIEVVIYNRKIWIARAVLRPDLSVAWHKHVTTLPFSEDTIKIVRTLARKAKIPVLYRRSYFAAIANMPNQASL